ncbi:PA domain-containing protein [Catalinimonas alkaloidigena]|uniref:Carboxypeptidase Q n=1 Tax=Catalinimonas alkaloidigena TaxID=1075417 RepID=A0A1G9KXH5_9BACT|nr:M20/M25/M40 family metallo-hydrolase [Catalinimonas alkaloidigena]SDL54045.1 PA domain-containing protein [Catalinimonas alkaloidigena]
MIRFYWLLSFFVLVTASFAQTDDAATIQKIYNEALQNGQSYENLRFLTKEIGARLSGSPQAAAAVEWGRQVMDTLGLDRVYLQEVMVPHWVRGAREQGRILSQRSGAGQEVNLCALGNSIGTGPAGVVGEVVEVHGLEELDALGRAQLAGKIVFFNRPFDPALVNTFEAYGGAVDQRGGGASAAAQYGAVGVVVRSMTTRLDDVPHTGSLRYAADVPKIPAVAISTNDADRLSRQLTLEPDLKFYFETHCQMLDDVLSYNVIGEIKGTQFPNEVILVGGHLDSWDLGEGAHDDGAGCVQAMEVLRILKSLGIKPKHTIRAVLFMNEENGLRGGRKYAEVAQANREKHLVAIESDRGGFTPRGFETNASPAQLKRMQGWVTLLAPYGLHEMIAGGGGADIGPLEAQGTVLMEYLPDPQRYFDYHHTNIDTFEAVNRRELELGAAAMASLVYLLDRHGLGKAK